jgi:hypothetical protein
MGFFTNLGAVLQASTVMLVKTTEVINNGLDATNTGITSIHNGLKYVEAQSARLLVDLANDVNQDYGWPNRSPEDVLNTLLVLKIVGSDLSERDQKFIKEFEFQQPEKAKQIEQAIEQAAEQAAQ